MNDSERAYARKLLDMINSVDAEGSKVMDDLRNDAFPYETSYCICWRVQ